MKIRDLYKEKANLTCLILSVCELNDLSKLLKDSIQRKDVEEIIRCLYEDEMINGLVFESIGITLESGKKHYYRDIPNLPKIEDGKNWYVTIPSSNPDNQQGDTIIFPGSCDLTKEGHELRKLLVDQYITDLTYF